MELYAGLDLHLRIPLSESWVMHLLRSNYLANSLSFDFRGFPGYMKWLSQGFEGFSQLR